MPDPKLTQLLLEDEIGEVIDAILKGAALTGDNGLSGDMILLSGRYHRNEKQMQKGLVSGSEYNLTLNKISNTLKSYYHERFTPPTGKIWDGENWVDELARPGTKTILYLAASPKDEEPIDGNVEFQKIIDYMKGGTHRDGFVFLIPQTAATFLNLISSLKQDPTIVHFSMHGESDHLIFANQSNESEIVPLASLVSQFKQVVGHTQLVILNACYSADLAREISKLGMHVAGHNMEITDTTAIRFVEGLYTGLANGADIPEAFSDGKATANVHNPEETPIIEIWKDGKKLDI